MNEVRHYVAKLEYYGCNGIICGDKRGMKWNSEAQLDSLSSYQPCDFAPFALITLVTTPDPRRTVAYEKFDQALQNATILSFFPFSNFMI